GSLVYANVFARPPAEVFAEHWPAGLSRTAMDPYYDLVATMLEVGPITRDHVTGSLPGRTRAMEGAVASIHRPAATARPLLAVTFSGPDADRDVLVPNRHGVGQRGCSFSGECVLGCNRGA